MMNGFELEAIISWLFLLHYVARKRGCGDGDDIFGNRVRGFVG